MTTVSKKIELSTNEEDDRLPTVFPTLVIGIGGTGVNTLRYLRRRLKDEFGTRITDEPPLVQLLGLDTVPLENRSSVEALHHHEYAYLGGFNAQKVIENLPKFPEIERWWDWDTKQGLPLGFISTGAKQLRTVGRLAFYRRFHSYNSRVEAQLDRLEKIDAHQFTHRYGRRPSQDQVRLPHVFIVASLAGGTGAGAFLDVACHLRNRLKNQARIIGALVMPSVFKEDIPSLLQQRRIRANAYAALMELDYFQSGNKFTTQFPGPGQEAFTLQGGIFTNIFLIDRANVTGFQLSTQKDVQQLIADAIFEMSVTPTAGHIWEVDANILREFGPDGKILAYSALGFSSLAVNERGRYEYNLKVNTEQVGEALVGWDYEASVVDALTQEIAQKTRDRSHNLTADRADAGVVYRDNLRDDCRRLIVDAIRTHVNEWGVYGTLVFVDALRDHYGSLLDSDQAQIQSVGQRRQAELEALVKAGLDGLKDTQAGFWRRAIDAVGARGPEEQDVKRRKAAEDALHAAEVELDAYKLLRAAASDLKELLDRLSEELNDCLTRLTSARQDMSPRKASTLPRYPLRTIEPEEYGKSANGHAPGNEPDETAVHKAAKELLKDWIEIREHVDDPAILWPNDPADVRVGIIGAAHQLTQVMAKNHTSLFNFLHTRSIHDPNGTQDLLRDFIRRCVPYCRLDFDFHNFSEKNIEPFYWLCMSAELKNDYDARADLFWALASGDHEFKTTDKPSSRPDRMDALCVSHGYPVSVFADLPDMFNEYVSKDLGASPLHLQCCWRWLMPPVHAITPEEEELKKARDHLFRPLCKNCPPPAGGQPDGKNPPAAGPPSRPKKPTDFGAG